MNIKFGHHELEVTNNDIIMYNDSCYQLMNRRITLSTHRMGICDTTAPILSKVKAKTLIKEGKLIKVKEDKERSLTFYRFNI